MIGVVLSGQMSGMSGGLGMWCLGIFNRMCNGNLKKFKCLIYLSLCFLQNSSARVIC